MKATKKMVSGLGIEFKVRPENRFGHAISRSIRGEKPWL